MVFIALSKVSKNQDNHKGHLLAQDSVLVSFKAEPSYSGTKILRVGGVWSVLDLMKL